MSYTLHVDSQIVSGTLAGLNSEFLVIADPSKEVNGFHEYTRIYILRDAGSGTPPFPEPNKVRFNKLAPMQILNAQGSDIGLSYDVYEFDAENAPTLSGSYSNYLPKGGHGFGSFVIVSSVPVEYTGIAPSSVRKAVETIQSLSGNMGEYAAHYAGKRPYIAKILDHVYGIADSVEGTVYLEILEELADGSFRSVNTFDRMILRQVELDDNEALAAGSSDNSGDEIRIVLGMFAHEGNKRIVKYLVAGNGYSDGEAPAAYTNNVTATVSAPEASADDQTDVSIPSSDKRTRAQLYTALKEAEKFGNRTIVESSFEANVAQIGYDSFSHLRIPEWAEQLPQGQLVSMVRALVKKLVDDRAAFKQRIRDMQSQSKHEPRVPDTQVNIIVGAYGYDN